MRIFKYAINPRVVSTVVSMPVGSKVISCRVQNGVPVIWALTPDTSENELREFKTYVTGEWIIDDINETHRFLDTLEINSGYIIHIFELLRR